MLTWCNVWVCSNTALKMPEWIKKECWNTMNFISVNTYGLLNVWMTAGPGAVFSIIYWHTLIYSEIHFLLKWKLMCEPVCRFQQWWLIDIELLKYFMVSSRWWSLGDAHWLWQLRPALQLPSAQWGWHLCRQLFLCILSDPLRILSWSTENYQAKADGALLRQTIQTYCSEW